MTCTRGLCLILIFILLPAVTMLAQTQPCAVNLPVTLVDKEGSLLNGLTAKDLTIQLHKKKLPVEDVAYDTGARRVLLIVDTNWRLPAEVRKTEAALASYLLARARTSDQFALLTARGAIRRFNFDQGNAAVLKAVEELAADPKEEKKAGTLLDTIMEGTTWFGAPQPGDAMLVMSDHLESEHTEGRIQGGFAVNTGPDLENSRVKFSVVAETLAERRIRVFGVQFGPVSVNSSTFEPNDENLIGLALGSGGWLLVDPMDAFGAYHINDARLERLRRQVYQMYGAIAQFYVLKLEAPMPLRGQQWKLELASDLRDNTRALYPRWFDPCSPEDKH